jgi:hypothetical protein
MPRINFSIVDGVSLRTDPLGSRQVMICRLCGSVFSSESINTLQLDIRNYTVNVDPVCDLCSFSALKSASEQIVFHIYDGNDETFSLLGDILWED